MSIPEHIVQLACKQTTGVGDPTPNAHRVLSWLFAFDYIEGSTFTNEHFLEVAAYVQEHYGVKPTTALLAESDPLLSQRSHPRRYPRNRQPRVPRPKTTLDHLFLKKEVS